MKGQASEVSYFRNCSKANERRLVYVSAEGQAGGENLQKTQSGSMEIEWRHQDYAKHLHFFARASEQSRRTMTAK